MSKLGIVICLLLGPPGWLYLAYKLLAKSLPAEPLSEWRVPKGIPKSYRVVKW
jgi:hypothetical protein